MPTRQSTSPAGVRGDDRVARSRRCDRIALGALAGGALLRALYSMVLHPPLDYVYSDMAGYVERAQRLASLAPPSRLDAFFPSGTHVVLALPMLLFGTGRTGLWAATVLWWALSAASPWLAWRWARRLVSVEAACAIAVLCSAWPLFVTQPTFFMSEVPALALLLGALLLAIRVAQSDALNPLEIAAFGVVAGLGFTVRPQLALNFAIVAIPLMWRLRLRLAMAGLAVATAVAPIVLVAMINHRATDAYTVGSENGGVNFFLAQCDGGSISTTAPDRSTYWISSPIFVQRHRGLAYHFDGRYIWDQGFFYRQGLHCLTHDSGGHHLSVIGRHVLDLTVTSDPWPQSDDPAMRRLVHPFNVGYSLILPAVVVVSVASVIDRRRRHLPRGEATFLFHLACLAPTVIVFVSEPRYRVPYDVFGLALVATLMVRLLGWEQDAKPARPDLDAVPTSTGAEG